MSALLSSFALFSLAWVLHVVWWRTRLPRRQMLALVAVFIATPLLVYLLWLLGGRPTLIELHDLPAIAIFYGGALGCYLIAYTAVEQTSPSLAVIQALETAGSAGCSVDELSLVITDANFVKPRLEALRQDGMLAYMDGSFGLTLQGKRAVQIAVFIARIFNIQKNA